MATTRPPSETGLDRESVVVNGPVPAQSGALEASDRAAPRVGSDDFFRLPRILRSLNCREVQPDSVLLAGDRCSGRDKP